MEPSFFNDKRVIYDDSLPSLENAPSVKEKVAKAEDRFARIAAKQQALGREAQKATPIAAKKNVPPPPSFWVTGGWKVVSVKSQAENEQFKAIYHENGDLTILGGPRTTKKGKREHPNAEKAAQ